MESMPRVRAWLWRGEASGRTGRAARRVRVPRTPQLCQRCDHQAGAPLSVGVGASFLGERPALTVGTQKEHGRTFLKTKPRSFHGGSRPLRGPPCPRPGHLWRCPPAHPRGQPGCSWPSLLPAPQGAPATAQTPARLPGGHRACNDHNKSLMTSLWTTALLCAHATFVEGWFTGEEGRDSWERRDGG